MFLNVYFWSCLSCSSRNPHFPFKGQKMDASTSHNIGYVCTTLQYQRGLSNKTAMRWFDAHGARTDYTFADMDHHGGGLSLFTEEPLPE